MAVGSIVFGPVATGTAPALTDFRTLLSSLAVKPDVATQSCNCIGPQPSETKCPCRLRGESEQGKRMIREGVTIDGVKYDLVPASR